MPQAMPSPTQAKQTILRSKFAIALIAISSLLFGTHSQANEIEQDRQLPIEISSDHAEISDQTGQARYTGNVIITQGKTRFAADSVLVTAENDVLSKIEAFGEPAKFSHESEIDPEKRVSGSAKQINYLTEEASIVFLGEAALTQGENFISGDSIQYDLSARAIKADGGEEQKGPVVIKYFPKIKDQASDTSENTSDGSTSP